MTHHDQRRRRRPTRARPDRVRDQLRRCSWPARSAAAPPSGTWSGGAGTFNPGRSALGERDLHADRGEIAAGGVTLTLDTNDPAGPCGAVQRRRCGSRSTRPRSSTPVPTRSCAPSSPQVQLAGSVGGGATGGTWSGGAGSFSPRATALDARYTPSAAEITAGGVTLTLTIGRSGRSVRSGRRPGAHHDRSAHARRTRAPTRRCAPPAPQRSCRLGQRHGHRAARGAAAADRSAPAASALNAFYTPSPAEIAAGSVTLTLTSAASTRALPAGQRPDDDHRSTRAADGERGS